LEQVEKLSVYVCDCQSRDSSWISAARLSVCLSVGNFDAKYVGIKLSSLEVRVQ